MIVTPNLGIGDILILKMYEINNSVLFDHFLIRMELIRNNRLNVENYKDFIVKLIIKLFNNPRIDFIESGGGDFYISSMNKYYIADRYNFSYIYPNLKKDYRPHVVFHTKARFDHCYNAYLEAIPQLIDFFSHLISNYDIYILGERQLENNFEVKQHNITSYYQILLNLKNNNQVIDLTKDGLYSDNSIENFEYEVQLMNAASLNIGLGWGGPMNISLAFTNTTCFWISNLYSPIFENNPFVYRNLHDYFLKINTISIPI